MQSLYLQLDDMKRKVLFLCTGNSARSQLAEGIVNAIFSQRWQADSAGTKPTGFVHPLALKALEEAGFHHQGRSKSVDEFRDVPFDVVVTVCDSAAEECPLWMGKGKRVHLGYPDPAKVEGTEEEQLNAFRQVRDDMRLKISELLSEWD
jgi:arsenate reductase (thioredoxin)